MNDEERDDLLIRVDERTKYLKDWADLHMAHHKSLLYSAVGLIGTLIIGLITAFVFG